MSTRLKALVVLGAAAMLITACGSSGGGTAAPSAAASAAPRASAAAPSAAPSASAASEKIKVTLLTKATGGFWDAMIAGAKKYETDHPNDIELTTNACKTNDDTPCQIAQIQDAVTKGAQAIVVSPMGVGVTDALNEAQQGRRPDRLRRQHDPRCRAGCGCGYEQRQGRRGCRRVHQEPAEVGRHHRSARSRAWRAEPRPAHRRCQEALDGTGVNVVIGGQQTLCSVQDRRLGDAGPAHQVPEAHSDLLGVRRPGEGCRDGRGVQAAPAADLRLRR